jgi:hypothetical protein
MTTNDIPESDFDKITAGSMAAMIRAAAMARDIAIQTNTAIIIEREGKVVRVTADELRREKLEAESQAATANQK